MINNKHSVAHISLLLVAFVWGLTFVVVQNAIAFLEPFTFNAIRFFIAGLLLFLLQIVFNRNKLVHFNKNLIAAGMKIGFWLFIGYAFQTVGLLYTTSSKAGFITGLSVVLVPLFSCLLFKLNPGRNALIGAIVAAGGLYLLTMTDTVSLNIGDGYIFICAIGFAMHIIMTGKYSSKHAVLPLTIVQLLFVSLLSMIFSIVTEDWQTVLNPSIMFNVDVIMALLITSVFATALAFLAQTAFQQYTTPARVALIFATEPVFAALAGYLWNDERLASTAVIGCGFIFAGMIFAEIPKKSNKAQLEA
nr:DMT family transporter [Cytobacillus gottheilii]